MTMPPQVTGPERQIGRYALFGEIASGGMATVHFGRLLGPVGFARTVAIKRLHPQFARDPEFVSMFLDEARVAARIQHPNVVATIDVVALEGELFLVMEYVLGESFSKLLRSARNRGQRVPLRIVTALLAGTLHGLHAAHEAKSEHGEALGIVHRDVSPQNVIVGIDGVPRVLDFGVAKAVGRLQSTREGQLKGKLSYMAPEQIRAGQVDRRTDIYAATIMLWEALVGRRLYDGDNEANVLSLVLEGSVQPPSMHVPDIPPTLDAIVMRGLERDPEKRFATAREMAIAIERQVGFASSSEVAEWVEEAAAASIQRRAEKVKEIESISMVLANGESDRQSSAYLSGDSYVSDAPTIASSSNEVLTGDPSTASAAYRLEALERSSARSKATTAIVAAVSLFLALLFGTLLVVQLNKRGGEASAAAATDTSAVAVPATPATTTASAAAVETAAPTPSAAASADADGAAAAGGAAGDTGAGAEPTKGTPAVPTAARTAATSTTAGKKTPPATTKTSKPAGGNCSPPYTIDAAGIRRPKPECM
jgi:eukaryotic-like serine/threonine-protein kinase